MQCATVCATVMVACSSLTGLVVQWWPKQVFWWNVAVMVACSGLTGLVVQWWPKQVFWWNVAVD